MKRCLLLGLLVTTIATSGACDEDTAGLGSVPVDETPERLADWNLFLDAGARTPRDGIVGYDMASPLFTDYTSKHRFIYLPAGAKIAYKDEAPWAFPVGTILIKTFAYPLDEGDPSKGERFIETRLMIHRSDGWDPETYVWNDDQTEAIRDVSGEVISVTRNEADGTQATFDYTVPTRAECRKCHGGTTPIDGAQATRPLGPKTAQLNMMHDYGDGKVSQIDHLATLGMLDRNPGPAAQRITFPSPDDATATVTDRARAYLDANCAHCHASDGEVFDKELWLDFASTAPDTDPLHWGVCKKPTSAGNAECSSLLDIVPGDPDSSLMVCRMESTGKGQMAPLGRNLPHPEGVDLVRGWINEMNQPPCSE